MSFCGYPKPYMNIGIDGGPLSIVDDRLKVGVYRDTLELIAWMSKLGEKHHFTVYVFTPPPREVGERFGKNVTFKLLTPPTGFMKVRLPLELAIHPVDVFIGTAQAIPIMTCPTIGIVNDLGFLHHPDLYGKSAAKLVLQTKQLVDRTSHIVCISKFTRDDVVSHYHIDPNKISVAYPGVSPVFTSRGASFRYPRPYILFVGSLTKSKNIPQAIRIFSKFLKQTETDYDFLLAGGDFWPDPEIKKTIDSLHMKTRVKLLGRVRDDTLAKLYRGATAFLTTSLTEGFCLPAAEAMGSGTPVVALDHGALKEVVGEAGLVVTSENHGVSALVSLCTKPEIREAYKKKAIERAKVFTSEKFAGKILDMIKL